MRIVFDVSKVVTFGVMAASIFIAATSSFSGRAVSDDGLERVGLLPTEELPGTTGLVARVKPRSRRAGPTPYSIGDKLKIVFYQRMRITAADGDAETPSDGGLVERAELTGVYVVQGNGQVIMPVLGNIDVEDQTAADVTAALEGAFKQTFRRDAQATIMIEDREPIYFIGGGSKAGTLKYSPGMTVLHAVALAGGLEDARTDAYVQMERLREKERLQKAQHKLKPLLARLTALWAEAANKDLDEAQPSSGLVTLVGISNARATVAEEARRRQVIIDSRKPLMDSLAATIAVAKQEKAILTSKLEIMDGNIKSRSEREKLVLGLVTRGSATRYLASQVTEGLADIKERREDTLSAIANAELKVTQSERELAKIAADARVELEKEIASIESDIIEEEATILGSQQLIDDLDVAFYREDALGDQHGFEIVRRTRQGTQNLEANESTELRPGDLVRAAQPFSHDVAVR